MVNKIFYAIVFFIVISANLLGIDICKIDEVELDQKKETISRGISLCVDSQEGFIIVDYKAQNIKRYHKTGQLLGNLLDHGYGPQEVAKPRKIDYRGGRLALVDMGKNRIVLYEIEKNKKIKKVNEFASTFSGSDIRLFDNKIVLAGSKINEKGR